MPVVGFAFAGNVSERVLKGLKLDYKITLESRLGAIDKLVSELQSYKGALVLGLGAYSGRDRNLLRLETICSNQFRSNVAPADIVRIEVKPFLSLSTGSKLASGMGNSWCNLVSYKLCRLREAGKIQGYSFVHIPAGFEDRKAARELGQMMRALEFA